MTPSQILAASLPYYPVNDFGPLMKGLVIGGVGIVHVFLAQFAIGGGMLLLYFERLRQRGAHSDDAGDSPDRGPHDPAHAAHFMTRYFQVLVLVSFVAGALTGVGLWFISIQVSPRTIGLMVDEFHWLWAVEWTFFSLEVVAGYTFYRFGDRLDDRTRLRLLGLYSVAAWASLFWINGILSWQLTPGGWVESGSVWAGFFNPGFWPSLGFRTVVALALAGLAACVVVNLMRDVDGAELDRDVRAALIRRSARFLAPMAIMPVLGAWYLAVMPADSRSWVLGGSLAMTLFLAMAAAASVLIAGYAIVGVLWRGLTLNGATATLLVVLAFAATAAGEMVREGARKPFTVRNALYSNAITPAELARLRETGSVTADPYPLANAARYPTEQLALGARVFRFQCSVCHTVAGANGVTHLTATWTTEQLRMNIAQLQRTKAFMPPFAGDAREVEAVVQLIRWEIAGRPGSWPRPAEPPPDPNEDPDEVLRRIDGWLDAAGTLPGGAGPDFRAREVR